MRRGNRSFALAGLVALLAFTAFAGTIIVTGLQNGMDLWKKTWCRYHGDLWRMRQWILI